MQVSPSFPEQLEGCSWRAEPGCPNTTFAARFPAAAQIAFRSEKFGLGLICYFLSGRNVGLRVQNYLAGIYVPPPSYSCSECSSPQWFCFRGHQGQSVAGLLSPDSVPPPHRFPSQFISPTPPSREDALTPTTSPPPPKAYGLPRVPLFFSLSGSPLMSYRRNHLLKQSSPFRGLAACFLH